MANIIILISQMRTQKVFVVVQSLSHVQLFATPWTAAHQAPLSSTITRSLHKFTSIESVIMSNHLILCRPLLLLHSIFPAAGSFTISQHFASGGQNVGALSLAPVLPMNIQRDYITDPRLFS